MKKDHAYFMGLCLQLALKTKGLTSPNPLVGALIVKNNKIISTGFHKKAGSDHAEIVALKEAGNRAKGATLYVTLEPCSSFGRTPPCTDAIIKSGIKKVVIGMVDPNPKHRGKGMRILKNHNIEVISGVLENRAREINQPFIKYITKDMSYVTVKTAQSIDGKISTRTGNSKWITSDSARRYVHKLRNNFDAIMIGINTAIKDDPYLNPEDKNKDKFYKIILDSQLKIKKDMHIFDDIYKFKVIIATTKDSILKEDKKIEPLIKKGAIILGANKKNGLLDLRDVFKKLAYFEITNVLVEGGGRVIGSLFDEKLVDYVLFFISPKIIGGTNAILSVQGKGINKIIQAQEIKSPIVKQIDSDILIEGALKEY